MHLILEFALLSVVWNARNSVALKGLFRRPENRSGYDSDFYVRQIGINLDAWHINLGGRSSR